MSKEEDYLQEGLERLESGAGLEASQKDIPTEERELLELASRLKSASWPIRDPQIVNTQRKQLGEIYFKETMMETKQTPWFNPFKDWRITIPFSVGMALLLVFGLILGVGSLAVRIENERQANLVEGPVVGKFEVQNLRQIERAMRNLPGNEAMLVELRGVVQILSGGDWVAVKHGMVVTVNDRLRTGPLSSVKLAFKDGSLARLGPDSEISIAALDVSSSDGTRQVVLMQWSGESDHMVAKAPVEGSRYEVQTPNGTGMAKGTQFQARVAGDQSAWFVSEGVVEVSNHMAAVDVGAGQMTSVAADEEPEAPVFFIVGEGEVLSTGETWVIAGQTFLTDDHTMVVGNPKAGDIVFFQGHLDGDQRVLDVVILVRRNPVNTFSMTGIVEVISDTFYIVSEQKIWITATTEIDDGILVDDLVQVDGIILTSGKLRADTIKKLEDAPGIPFDFTGVVEKTGAEEWVVSGISVTVGTTTTIQTGILISDVVKVQGWILPDKSWLAKSISATLDENRLFEFVGEIESKDAISWTVNGIKFETREWTDIDEGLATGDLVKVTGHILPDGTWVAFEIHKYDTAMTTFLIGRVFSKDPWIVGGVPLSVTEKTVISGTITVGMLVRVELLLEDGKQTVVSIAPLEGFTWALGCQEFVVTVENITDGQVQVAGWPALPLSDTADVYGDLHPGAIALVIICFNEDNTVKVTYIFILDNQNLEESEPGETSKEAKVQVCHSPNGKNPHVINIASAAVPAHLGHGDYVMEANSPSCSKNR